MTISFELLAARGAPKLTDATLTTAGCAARDAACDKAAIIVRLAVARNERIFRYATVQFACKGHEPESAVEWSLAEGRQRCMIDNLESVTRQIRQPGWLVGEENHLAHPNVTQNLRTDTIITEIRLGRVQVRTRSRNRPAGRIQITGNRFGFPLQV